MSHTVTVLPLALGNSKSSLPYLAMGMVVSYLRDYVTQQGIDSVVVERLVPAGYMRRPVTPIYPRVERMVDPVCLFSSYVWNHDLNLEVASKIKEVAPAATIIFGGPHVPKYEGETEEFLASHPFIDIAVLGEGEVSCAEIVAALALGDGFHDLRSVDGIVFTQDGSAVRTASRQRLKDIRDLPSPYLTGEFLPWCTSLDMAVLETNRGCPYGCTYCDWGSATLAKVSRFEANRVIDEINHIAENEFDVVFIADANFGMLEQDIDIAKALVHAHKTTGFPKKVESNFAKNGGRRLMSVIKILHEGGLLPTGILALQTTDPTVLKAIARDNIKLKSYEKMMTYFNAEQIPMSSDLMIGLPGQTLDSFATDLQFCFDWKVSAVANYTSMMPNAPMAERGYRQQYQIATDDTDLVVATSSFGPQDMLLMRQLYTAYQFHVRYGVLKYVLYFLQLEKGIPAIRLLQAWLDAVKRNEPGLSVSQKVFTEIFEASIQSEWAELMWDDSAEFLFNDIESYCDEVFDFAVRAFDVTVSESERRALAQTQATVMPHKGREYPYQSSLEHDVVAYLEQIRRVPSLQDLDTTLSPLSGYPVGVLKVGDSEATLESIEFKEVNTHSDAWELPSEIRMY